MRWSSTDRSICMVMSGVEKQAPPLFTLFWHLCQNVFTRITLLVFFQIVSTFNGQEDTLSYLGSLKHLGTSLWLAGWVGKKNLEM